MSKLERDPKHDPYAEPFQRHAPPSQRGRRQSIAPVPAKDDDPKTVPRVVPSDPRQADITSASNTRSGYETKHFGAGYSSRTQGIKPDPRAPGDSEHVRVASRDDRPPRDSEQARVSSRDDRAARDSELARNAFRDDRSLRDSEQVRVLFREDRTPRTSSQVSAAPLDDRHYQDQDEDRVSAYESYETRDFAPANVSTRDRHGPQESDHASGYGRRDLNQPRVSTRGSQGLRGSDQALSAVRDDYVTRSSDLVRPLTHDGGDNGDSDQATALVRRDRDVRTQDQNYRGSRHNSTNMVGTSGPIAVPQHTRYSTQRPDDIPYEGRTPPTRYSSLPIRERDKLPAAKPAKSQRRDTPKAQEDEPSDDDADEYPFTVIRSEICRLFVKIPVTDHKDRIDFLEDNMDLMHKDVVQINESLLIKQAIDFSRMSKQMPSVACILCLAMIRQSKDQKQLTNFLKRLADPSSEEKREYIKHVKAIQDAVTNRAEEEGKLTLPARKPAKQVIKAPAAAPGDDVATVTSLGISELFGAKIRPEYTIQASDEPPVPEELNSKYRLRSNGRQFFCPGRVFGVLWHEGTAKTVVTEALLQPRQKDRTLSRGPYGQAIYSHFRRMVVVKTRRASCWCVAIGTYGGQGLGKKGLQKEEINAHAIMHDSTQPATYLRGEPHTDKRPIRIDMASGASLDVASRVHLGKPYNVEFNLKVMDVGRVHDEDLDILINYVKMELGL